MEKIFRDENETCEIDFSSAIYATDELHDVFKVVKGSFLCDVDFVAETENELIFIEYKNSAFKGADCPKAFKPFEHITDLARKYYDSLNYIRAAGIGKNKNKIYIYILEVKRIDPVFRKSIRNRLKESLPFKLQRNLKFKMIDDVQVFSIENWNKKYKEFPAKKLK